MRSTSRRLGFGLCVFALGGVLGGCRCSTPGPGLGSDQTGASANDAPVPADDPDASLAPRTLGLILPPGDPGPVDITFQVYADRDQHAISPLIYGTSDGKEGPTQRWGLIRSGGNRLTAYNWENNASNAGADYLFQNDSLLQASDAPAQTLLDAIDGANSISVPVVITLSNADYVAADKNGGGDVRQSGPNYLTTRFKRNHPKKPTPFGAVPDTTDGDVYQDEAVAFLKRARPHARIIFSMDNEPELWAHTHAEIFPKPVTYADLWQRNHDFAKATKEAWPGAEVMGFVSYGYMGFVSLQNAPDSGGRNFIDWYLDQAKAAQAKEGVRLIDYLDLHWYPEAQGGGQRIVSDAVGPEVEFARQQAPRSLWDRNYKEASWIRDMKGGPLELIPWVKSKIRLHYPGTKLSFSEWNYGGGNHISGAIAVADVLGTFGKYDVGLAAYWPMSHHEPFAFAAFRAFRNYDGQGSTFGDTSIAATTTDLESATVYASLESKDPSRTVVVIINKATVAKNAGIRVAHSTVFPTAKVYALTGAQPALTVGPTLKAVDTNAFKYELPPQSVSVLVLQP